ncbi:hypothetical protein FSARC_14737 [Fusarium sarcochroum]|uniref:protein S-acyltransferase n=1 Tax=Fusarium sarcochroum TaxID=1208366 RepID=A0A8H4WN76_9HYPO|nr:hypothetical protein FSARC_14737 [Fusarium sarcochroum]
MLDQCHADLPTQPNDPNTYTLGSIGQHNVVVTCLPKGMIGTVSAAQVATRMVSSFPSIKFGLMVGIGGGVPSNKVRLGDIVVSTSDGPFPGVVQWDFGKADGSGEIQRVGSLNNPPTLLLTALTKLETQHDLGNSRIPDYLEDLKKKFPRLASRYLRSDSLEDTLFKADYDHISKGPSDTSLDGEEEDDEEADSCRFCDRTNIIRRKPREMRVHYGLIASGNQVIKDAAFRDRINGNLGGYVRCIEMEAAGLMNNFPCLVVRGICDYADSHKNKDWQEHAAIVAAAFTKELLQYVQPNDIEQERPVRDMLKNVDNNTSVIRHEVDQMKLRQDKRHDILILNWLTAVDYGLKQSDHFKERQAGTGCWLLETEAFRSWLDTPGQTLFCPGIPGGGKTVLTSLVVNNLISNFRGDLSTGVAYIYCSSKQQHEQTAEQLLTSLLKQLASSQPTLPTHLKALYDEHSRQRTRPTLSQILEKLALIVSTYSRVFILIDALDECQASECSRSNLLFELSRLQKQHQINVFATSRGIPIILSDMTSHFETIASLEILANKRDITAYLKGNIERLPSFVRQDQNLQEMIIRVISESVDGMFLLARIYLYLLTDKLRDADIRNQLKLFEERGTSQDGLRHAYRETMDRINGQMPGWKLLAHKVLSWITYAKRDLTVAEVRHALATSTEKCQLDDGDFYHVDDMVTACAGLVTVDETSNIIRLIHYTTQEYFNRWPDELNLMTERDITKTCVSYLSFESFGKVHCMAEEDFEQRLHIHPFYDYAAKNWGHHARASSISSLELANFFSKEGNMYASVQVLMASGPWQMYYWYPGWKEVTKLHLAANFGLARVVQDMLEDGLESDPRDSNGRTPLSYAANHGHESVVSLLLDNGAKVDTLDDDGQTPLSFAAEHGHRAVTQLLVDKGSDLDSPSIISSQEGWKALYSAVDQGHMAIIHLLLERGAGTNYNEETLLPLTVSRGQEEIVHLLLEWGANMESVSTGGHWGQTSLSIAARLGHEAIVRLLSKNGAALDPRSEYYGRTPLSFASEYGHGTVVEFLLRTGRVDPESKDEHGKTPLTFAAIHGHVSVVQILLETHSVDVDSIDNEGQTPLSHAAHGGFEIVASLLIEAGAKPDSPTGYFSREERGRTPLSLAAEGGHKAVAQLLLEKGANPNSEAIGNGNGGRTPLSFAAEKGHENTIRLLVEKGANVEHRTTGIYNGRTPKSFPVRHTTIVRLLPEKGADPGPRHDDVDNRTPAPLSHAAYHKKEVAVKLRLDTSRVRVDESDRFGRTPLSCVPKGGARPNAAEAKGRTPLSYAAQEGHEAVVRLLVEMYGAKLDSADAKGRTPLSYAAQKGHEAVVRLLAEMDSAGLNFADIEGRTPLSYASEEGREGVVEYLLKEGGRYGI